VTYSIVAVDPATGARGVAVASKAMCVGAHVPWGRAGFGAIATQAWHDLRYGWEGLALLEAGHSAASVVQKLTYGDADAPHRQLGIVDRNNHVASYTGSSCMPWAGGMCGKGYAVQGNLLAGATTVEAMAARYEALDGRPFAYRLVQALLAGDEAGGDRRGRQSAAVKVWRAEPSHSTDVDVIADLRIDDAKMPVHDLAAMVPRLWLDYGTPRPNAAMALEGEGAKRVASKLGVPLAEVEPALIRWAGEQNLESRLLAGAIDPTVLAVLESGIGPTLEWAAAEVPQEGWPA
jgi:uncharacterized Ntn-hydrolase superfamily protein